MNKLVSIIIPVYNQEDLVIRAIESIPLRDDIEIIAIDDCSTDFTGDVLDQYAIPHYSNQNDLRVIHNKVNMGVGYSVNRGYNLAKGDWIVLLGSDDYFYKDKLNKFIDNELDDNYDLIYFDLEDNNQVIWESNEKDACPGSVKFIKRSFLGSTRGPNDRVAEDLALHKLLLKKNPKCKYTGQIIKHYNYPRENSLTWLRLHKGSAK